MHDPVRTIEGQGLTLREWRDDDAAALMAVTGDEALLRFTRVRARDRGQALRWLHVQRRDWSERVRFSFAVVDEAGELLGNVAVKRGDRPEHMGEVGYWTAWQARGRGVAGRAVALVTRWAFTEFPALARLELRHQVDNAASCRVAVKTGFRYEATLSAEHPFPLEGHLHALGRLR